MNLHLSLFKPAMLAAVLGISQLAAAAPAAPAAHLEGVDPRVYLQARKPEPTVVRELKQQPALARQILRDGPAAFLVDDSAYPAHIKDGQRQALRVLEQRALVVGALIAVADTDGKDAVAPIAGWLGNADALVRAEAAEQLGRTRGAVIATLVDVAEHDADANVRAAACAGLGRHRSAAALTALEPFVLDRGDAVRQAGAVRALATLGSAWAWQARGDEAEGAKIRQAAQALLQRAGKPATR